MFDDTVRISVKTLGNPIFPTSIKCSLLPRPDCFVCLFLVKVCNFPMCNYYYQNIVYFIVYVSMSQNKSKRETLYNHVSIILWY